MAFLRDDERSARVDQIVAEIQSVRDAATRQLQDAQRTIDESKITLKRLNAMLAELESKKLR